MVDLDSLWRAVVAALVAATLVAICLWLAVLGGTRSGDSRIAGQTAPAPAWAAVAVVGLLGTGAAIPLGLIGDGE